MSAGDGATSSQAEDRASKAARLQRILEDYANLKKQNAILKKLMGQEQKKVHELEEGLARKEIQLRTATEENDLVSFNLRGLQKRCELLQEELQQAAARAQSGGGWFGSGAKAELQQKKEELAVVQRELLAKIGENEHLHMQMFDLKRDTSQSLTIMEQKLGAMKRQLQSADEQLQQMHATHSKELSELSDAKELLAVSLSQAEAALDKTKSALVERELQTKRTFAEFSAELETSRSLIARKLPFDDTRTAAYNRFNVPPFDRRATLELQEIVDNGLTAARACLDAVESLYTALARRLAALLALHGSNENDSLALAAGQRAAAALHDVCTAVPPLRAALLALYDQWKLGARDGESDAGALHGRRAAFFQALHAVAAAEGRYTAERIDGVWSSPQLQLSARTVALQEQIRAAHAQAHAKLDAFVTALHGCFMAGHASSADVLQLLAEHRDGVRVLADAMRQSAELENRESALLSAPPVPVQACLESSGFLSKLHAGLNEYFACVERQRRNAELVVRGAAVSTEQQQSPACRALLDAMAHTSADFLAQLNGQIAGHVPVSYEATLQLKQQSTALQQQIAALTQQSAALQQRASQLLHEKQTVQAELSTLRDSFNQKQARVNSLLHEISLLRSTAKPTTTTAVVTATTSDLLSLEPVAAPASGDLLGLWEGAASEAAPATDAPTPTPTADDGGAGQRFALTVMDESGRQSNSLELSAQQREREAEIERYYQAQLQQVCGRIAELDAKAAELARANAAADKRVKELEGARDELVKEKEGLAKNYNDLREELDITRKSYDTQLTMMTQHLIELEQNPNNKR